MTHIYTSVYLRVHTSAIILVVDEITLLWPHIISPFSQEKLSWFPLNFETSTPSRSEKMLFGWRRLCRAAVVFSGTPWRTGSNWIGWMISARWGELNDFCDRPTLNSRLSIKFPSQRSQRRQQHLLMIWSRCHNCNHKDHDVEHAVEHDDDDDQQEHYHDNHDVQWSCLQSIVRHSEADRWEILSIVGSPPNITLRYRHYWHQLPTLQCDMLPKWTRSDQWSWGVGFSKQQLKRNINTFGH